MRYSILHLLTATGVVGGLLGLFHHYGLSRTLFLSLVCGMAIIATRTAVQFWKQRNPSAKWAATVWTIVACLAWAASGCLVVEIHQAFDVVAVRKTRHLRQLTGRQFAGLSLSFHKEPKASCLRVHGTVEDESEIELLKDVIADVDFASVWPRGGSWGVRWDVTAPTGRVLRKEWTPMGEFVH